ncbi:MAG TPA: peptidyl-prolyl cis-trans isomerase [Candidatus Binatia bacterium]|nr:peptidyl-prolyl cis-trans isomerase [Candidatus Binatia bacterium]
MQRFTLVLALSCVIGCTAYGQAAPPQAAPPAATANAPQAAPPPAANPQSSQKPGTPPAGMTPGKPASPAGKEPAAPASNIPPTEAVITLKGACPVKAGGTPPAGCVSKLTREQFEQLTNALQPPERGPVPPEVRRRFATQYAKLLMLADAARELGLENDPKVKQIFAFARNQILAESLNQHYLEKFAHPSEQQIQDYYNKNVSKYKEATLQRIIIPVNQGNTEKPKPSEEEQKAYAEKVRQQWVDGGDPAKLEKEAMEHNGISTAPPDINVGARRPGSIPEAHEGIFGLKQGEISPVYADPAAFYIYKVVSSRQVPVDEVRTTISQTVQRQMFNDKMQELQNSVTPVLNEAYFGPETPPAAPGMRPGMPPLPPGVPGRPGAPAAGTGPGHAAGAPPQAAPPAASEAPPAGNSEAPPK